MVLLEVLVEDVMVAEAGGTDCAEGGGPAKRYAWNCDRGSGGGQMVVMVVIR